MMKQVEDAGHVVIVGNGVAGVTAARFVRKLSRRAVTIVSDETDHFYARTALMYVYMGHMRYQDTKPYADDFWEKNGLRLVRDRVEHVDVDARRLTLRDGAPLAYDVLLIATGSRPNYFGWPGQELDGVQGLYGMPDLERMERNTRGVDRAVVVGGGLIGVEMAEMLHSRRIPVTFLVREAGYMDYLLPPAESDLVGRTIREHGIDLRLSTALQEILPDGGGRVRAVRTLQGEQIPCGFVGLTVGVSPNIDFVRSSGVETNRGILVNRYFETNVPGVYAAGDCAEFREEDVGHRRIEQLWYSARRHGRTVAHTICGRRMPYDRGVFFNSAKFFDLEYQTYGRIDAVPGEGVASLCWQHPGGKRLIRIDHAAGDGRVLGFNLLGVRFRHEVCARWIREGRSVAYVLDNLEAAHFDPEFFRRHARDVRRTFAGEAPAHRRPLWRRLLGRHV